MGNKLFNKRLFGTTSSSGGTGVDKHNKGYFATLSDLQAAYPTAEAGDYAIVSANNHVYLWDTSTSAWVDSGTSGSVISVNNKTGAVVLTADDVSAANKDLSNLSSTGEAHFAKSSDIKDATITITQGGVTKGTFTTNQGTNATIALESGGGSGNVDDVQVNGTSVVTDRIANIPTATASSLGVSKAIQVTTMPTASATYLNQVVQFIGDTTTDYEQGLFYICELQGSTYSWNYLPTDLIASTTDFGLVKPDGTTITINNGIISSTGGGSGVGLYTLEGLSITSSNTDIRTLLQAVDAKNLPVGSIITGAVDLSDAPADNISNSNIHIESYKFTDGSTTSTIYRATLTSQGAAPYQWFIEYWNTHPEGSMAWVEAPLAFYSMPTASSKYANMVAQFVGSDDGIHVQGKFYICQEVTPVTDPPTYLLNMIHVEPVGSSSDFGLVKVDNSSIIANSGVISANKATGNYSTTFVGNPATTTSALNVGANSTAHGWYATALGCDAVVGDSANDVRTAGAIQLGRGTNTEAGTFKVGLSTNGTTWNNYKLIGSDGKIPPEMLPSSATTKVYTLDELSITSTNTDIRTLVQAIVAKNLSIGSIVTGSVQLTDAPADNATDAMVTIVSYQLTEGGSTDTIYDITFNSRIESPYQWHAEYWVSHPTADVGWVSAPLAFYNMPIASATYNGKIAQYIGVGDGIRITGKFYICQEVTPVTDPATYEWVLLDISTVKDVQVNGTSVLSSGVANIPYASTGVTGVIATSTTFGTTTSSSGLISSVEKTYSQYQSSGAGTFIGKGTLENVITGRALETQTGTITSGSTLTLANNYVYSNSTAIASLTIAYPTTYTSAFCAEVNLVSGSTATTLTLPASIIMKGDDCSSDVFTPVANASYSIMFSSTDGSNKVGIVMKIA